MADLSSDLVLAGNKSFQIIGTAPSMNHWKQHGLRIHVLEGTLSSSDTAEISIKAYVGGNFVFPNKSKRISAIYAILVSKPLLKPLRLEVEHCAKLTKEAETRCLKFVIAPGNPPKGYPHSFSVLEGGFFPLNNRYGIINLDTEKGNNLVGIICPKSQPEYQNHNGHQTSSAKVHGHINEYQASSDEFGRENSESSETHDGNIIDGNNFQDSHSNATSTTSFAGKSKLYINLVINYFNRNTYYVLSFCILL